MNPFLPEIPFFCIHLERAKEREAYMTHFQNSLGRQVKIWAASEGSEVAKLGWPRRHPIEAQTNDGNLGCLDSHLRLLQHMLDKGYETIGIFEDDAELTEPVGKLQELYEEASALEPKWDILVLGATEWVDSTLASANIRKPTRFWGTHAFLIRREAAQAALETHKKLQEKGYAYPADWFYSAVITQNNLVAYGPRNSKLIQQKPGLVSAISGKVRR
jgi:GR25 family glycosyltransferase involved in LPS biosynthesis